MPKPLFFILFDSHTFKGMGFFSLSITLLCFFKIHEIFRNMIAGLFYLAFYCQSYSLMERLNINLAERLSR